jgi:hypothetical protein
MIELIFSILVSLAYVLNTSSLFYFTLFPNYLVSLNILSILILGFVILYLKKKNPVALDNNFYNVVIILSFFNILLITICSELAYWAHFSLSVIPIPLLNLIILPFIIKFRIYVNDILLLSILYLTESFYLIFNFCINVFLVNPILMLVYFLNMLIMSFGAQLFIIYFILSIIFAVCLFILRSPYLFELIESPNLFENILYIRNNIEDIVSVNIILNEQAHAQSLLFCIMIKSYKNNIKSARFISSTTTAHNPNGGITEAVFDRFLKIRGIGFKPETLKALVIIAKEHPQQTAGFLIAAGVPITYAFILQAYTLKLKQRNLELAHEAKLTELTQEIKLAELTQEIKLAEIARDLQVSNNTLELAKLQQAKEVSDSIKVMDVTPTSLPQAQSTQVNPPQTTNSGSGCILQMTFENGDAIYINIYSFLNNLFENMFTIF